MDFIEGESRGQAVLFPEVLDDYITTENVVRFIDAFVEGLEMEAMGFDRTAPSSPWYKSIFHKTHGNAARQ